MKKTNNKTSVESVGYWRGSDACRVAVCHVRMGKYRSKSWTKRLLPNFQVTEQVVAERGGVIAAFEYLSKLQRVPAVVFL